MKQPTRSTRTSVCVLNLMKKPFIATDGNPLDDITAVRRVVFVMKGGKVYRNEGGRR